MKKNHKHLKETRARINSIQFTLHITHYKSHHYFVLLSYAMNAGKTSSLK